MKTEKMEKFWGRFSDTFDRNQEYVVGKGLLDDISLKLDRLPDLGDVVELGCGTGVFSEILSKKADRIILTDLSEELLEKAKFRLKNDPGVSFQKEDCNDTSFSSESFDTVFMANLLHVIEHPSKALKESYRILKPGGMLITVTFTNFGMRFLETVKMGVRFLRVWGRPPRHTHTFSPESLSSMAESAGFSITESVLLGDRTRAVFITGRKITVDAEVWGRE